MSEGGKPSRKRFAKTLRLTSDQLVCVEPNSSLAFVDVFFPEIAQPEARREQHHFLAISNWCRGLHSEALCMGSH